ncbi:hypothetical protein AB0L06_16630 [Spirillospora sp. NPDC052269]
MSEEITKDDAEAKAGTLLSHIYLHNFTGKEVKWATLKNESPGLHTHDVHDLASGTKVKMFDVMWKAGAKHWWTLEFSVDDVLYKSDRLRCDLKSEDSVRNTAISFDLTVMRVQRFKSPCSGAVRRK